MTWITRRKPISVRINAEAYLRQMRKGFDECWRVLRAPGTLHFKWAESSKPLKEVLKLFPVRPLFKVKQHVSWTVFAKGTSE